MSLDKAIAHGKDHRKPYRGSKDRIEELQTVFYKIAEKGQKE